MSNSRAALLLPAVEAYRLWASEYDDAPNPLLSLEERHLAPLLAGVAKRDVIDLGCGTGRWLKRLSKLEPKSLTGVDLSAEMLEQARRKLNHDTCLVQADSAHTSLAAESADWILASFLLSYVESLNDLAHEAVRLARAGAVIHVSDVHPAVSDYGWKRTFRHARQVIEIQTHPYRLQDLHNAMNEAGFELASCNEYSFGEVERQIFILAGRPDLYLAVEGLPVLLLASYRRNAK